MGEGMSSGTRAVEAHGQHTGDVEGGTVGAVLDLVAARRAVGDNKGCSIRSPHSGEQRGLGHRDEPKVQGQTVATA